MKEEIPREEYEALLKEIASADSPVGIDAKHTHILILHKLNQLEERLERIEAKLDASAGMSFMGRPSMPGLGSDMDMMELEESMLPGMGIGMGQPWMGFSDEEEEEGEGIDGELGKLLGLMLEAVAGQVENNDPPATRITMERLMEEEGMEEEEAREMIAMVLYKEMSDVMDSGVEFNEFRYIQQLHKLPELPDFGEEDE